MSIERPGVRVPRILPRPLRPFRHRDYRLLATSMTFSLLASGLWLVATPRPGSRWPG